jgi:rubredoxin
MPEAPRPAAKSIPAKVIDRQGAIVLVEHPNGERVRLVICPVCEADRSRISQAIPILTPEGLQHGISHPVRCPECGAGLCQVPKLGIVRPPTRFAS